MNLNRVTMGIGITMRQLLRRRITLVLLLVIPSVFIWVVYFTTADRIVPFKLAAVSEDTVIEVAERHESLVFIVVAAVGFLASFLGLNLVQKSSLVHRRLILCGYKTWEIFSALFAVLLLVVVFLALYVGIVLTLFFTPSQFVGLLLGMFAAGLVYGSYGLLSGVLIRGELEGILLIVLLANIDAGWLQNPLFYEGAQHKAFIRYLPAWFPSQASLTAAFTAFSYSRSLVYSILYGLGLITTGLVLYMYKMRIHK